MFAFLDLKTRMFISKQPDEKDTEKQRGSLERQLPRVAAANPDAVVTVVHMDDTSDVTDWQSELVFGAKGGAAVIEKPATVALDISFDASKALKVVTDAMAGEAWRLQNDYKSKLAELHNSIRTQASELQNAFDKELVAFHKRVIANALKAVKPKVTGKATVPMVIQAGYDASGKWLDEGTLLKPKKGK